MNSEEQDIVKLFLQNVDDLFNHSLIKNSKLKLHTTLSNSDTDGFSVSKIDIEKEGLESLLVRLRRFTNKSEIIYFNKVINILMKNEKNKISCSYLNSLKDLFQNKGNYKSLILKQNQDTYSPEQIFDFILNGKMFHVDVEKRKIVDEISDKFVLFNDSFIISVISKINALIDTRRYLISRVI